MSETGKRGRENMRVLADRVLKRALVSNGARVTVCSTSFEVQFLLRDHLVLVLGKTASF